MATSSNPASPSTAWFVVTTKPHQEKIARENLANQGFETYLPKIAVNKNKKGRWRQVIEVLFPGYLFVQLDLGTQNIAPVRSTVGVRELVRFGNQLVPVPQEAIELIRQHEENEHAWPRNPSATLKPGDRLTVVSGSFEGLDAVFQMPKSEDRVMVLINILGSQRPVSVDINAINPST